MNGIRIAVPAISANVDVGVSPLAECALSLHVLSGRRHHPLHHRWARQARSLPEPLRRRLRRLRFAFRFVVPDMLLAQRANRAEAFEAELGAISSLDVDRFALDMLRPLYDHGGRADAKLLRDPTVRAYALAAAERQGVDSDAVELLFDDAEALRVELVALMEEYWRAAFGVEWRRLRSGLIDRAAGLRQGLRREGIYQVLQPFARSLALDAEREELAIALPHDHRVEVSAERRLSLVASAYAWPHVHVNCDEPWPLLLVLPLGVGDAPTRLRPPKTVSRGLRAMADDTRLQILRLLARRPRTPQELAPLLRLSQSGLSRHLNALRAAGLVETERQGYWRVHRANLTRLDETVAELNAFIRPGSDDALDE